MNDKFSLIKTKLQTFKHTTLSANTKKKKEGIRHIKKNCPYADLEQLMWMISLTFLLQARANNLLKS